MPFTTWIRDLFGIRKDVIDTKKAKLEITRLEAEERERDFLIRASRADIEKYDPKTQLLLKKIAEDLLNEYNEIHEYEQSSPEGDVISFAYGRELEAARVILERLNRLHSNTESK
jgi:hypothetical protein